MEEDESPVIDQEEGDGDGDGDFDDHESEPEPEPLLNPEPETSAVQTAFAAMKLKREVEVADDEATKRRNEWEDASDDAASSDSEPETEEDEFEDVLTDAKPGMGAGEEVLHYNPDVMFDRIVAYFDLSSLAQKNGLEMPRGNVEEGDKK